MLGTQAQRILLVAAPRAIRTEVEEALQALGSGHVLHWVSEPGEAPLQAEELGPDVILIDEGLPDVLELIGRLARVASASTIIFLAPAAATEAIGDATFAGARSFLPKPVRPEALGRILAQVQAQARAGRGERSREAQGHVVVFCAPKGGTGRTTLTINTAIGLIQAGESSVALVDADYAAPAVDVCLNLYPERSIADLIARLSQMDEALLQGVLAQHASGLRVLMAPEPNGLEPNIRGSTVQQVLDLLQRSYRWTIVDLGLPMDETAYAFIDASDLVILSVLPEMVGLRNMRTLIDQLVARGIDEERLWVVVNRATMTGGVSVADIEQRLHTSVRYRVPDDQPLATQAVNRGVPIVVGNRTGTVVRALHGLASEVRRALAEPEEAKAGRRLFGRGR